LPFLLTNAKGYFSGAFDFGREFFYKWTVNLKFFPEEIFLDKRLSLFLLISHVIVLLIFAQIKWTK